MKFVAGSENDCKAVFYVARAEARDYENPLIHLAQQGLI
jgi:hypothetical protein